MLNLIIKKESEVIEFLLHNDKVQLQDINPNTTVLQFLREHRQLNGTKEGCASGDCGACTVVIVQLDEQNQLCYKSINACITLISALHGKQLISVEALQQQQLHSVQQAMVDCDGSQCGFCTPGFVMSLFALQKNSSDHQEHEVQQALAGNLCRCTGYRAINRAAEQALKSTVVDHFDPLARDTTQSLIAIRQRPPKDSQTGLNYQQQQSHLPEDLTALAQLLIDYPTARIIAGGTDLAVEITQRAQQFSNLICVQQVSQLQEQQVTDQHIEIGAAVSLHQCQQLLAPYFRDFSQMLERFASLQIRNQGTLGGNIANASPIGDTPPALIALDAKLILRRGTNTRELPVQDFFLDYRKTALQPSEFIEKILIPLPEPHTDSDWALKIYKITKRLDDDISAICAANFLRLNNRGEVISIRLAYGGMAAIAKRASKTEQALIGKEWSYANIENALACLSQDFQPLSDFRASSDYRLLVAENLLRKLYLETQHMCPGSSHSAANSTIETRISNYV